ncbi:cobalt-precorrin 5A hydrolase [Furfurilactobacillus sp. WILCCON 0119]
MTKTKVGVLALTATGCTLAERIHTTLAADVTLILPEKFAAASAAVTFKTGGFRSAFATAFGQYDCVICVMATGIVVRQLAPLLQDKLSDPAVLVVDEQAHHVISLLAGHMGGANDWTVRLAEALASDPVITTATDTEGVQALDVLAREYHGWYAEFKTTTKRINGRLAARQPVALWIDPVYRPHHPALTGFTVVDELAARPDGVPLVVISDRTDLPKLVDATQLIPRVNVLGIGCRKDVTVGMMQAALTEFCQEQHLAWRSIAQLASIEKKAHEAGIHYLAETLNVPVTFYSAATLQTVADHYPQSSFVTKTVGVGAVAEPAAEIASGVPVSGERFAAHEITLALSRQQPWKDEEN